MIAVVQRVTHAAVTVESENYRAEIGERGGGLCVLLGVEQGDTVDDAAWLAGKIARLRIFRDEQDKMNRSVQDIPGGPGEVLLISQFTLAGDCAKGNRPSFVRAAAPELGEALYEKVAEHLRLDYNLPVKVGLFGAMMLVEIANDGPVTLIIQR